MRKTIHIAGGGLAGSEAAMRAVAHGLSVVLWEMKPKRFSPAHKNPDLGELVCSNSFRSRDPESAVGLLKLELGILGSVVMEAALETRVPAGKALAADRELFSRAITWKLSNHPDIEIRREEFAEWPEGDDPAVLATGPLSSDAVISLLGEFVPENLFFYDALAPIVTRDSLNAEKLFVADRYGEGEGDYLNAPMNDEEFDRFLKALLDADQLTPRPFEEVKYFEGCLPIEVMARRGPNTLAFGPMKPVGLVDPRTGKTPRAVVQLRRENKEGSTWNMVGFQTRLTIPSQSKVFRTVPGLENAEFVRFGAIHRNTYLNAPEVLDPFQRLKAYPRVFVGGQLSGVEGYVESAAQGLWAGENASRVAKNLPPVLPPPDTASGALLNHLRPREGRKVFEPSNVNFGLFPPLPGKVPKKDRGAARLEIAVRSLKTFLESVDYPARGSNPRRDPERDRDSTDAPPR